MKVKLFLLISVLLIIFQVFSRAAEVSVKRALGVAGNFVKESVSIPGSKDQVSLQMKLVEAKKFEDHSLYYILSHPIHDVTVIVSADDRITPILGYTFKGNFYGTDLPPACADLLQFMEQQIIRAIKSDLSPSAEIIASWRHYESPTFSPDQPARSVAPLLSSSWGQGCFFNAGCPNDTSAHATCLHAPAGSGAAAMAQIMKFYQYPAHGSGEHGYPHPAYGIQYANFGTTNYNWSTMPDTLTGPDEDVAQLIYQCGVAQNMNYGPVASTSLAAEIDTAFVKYFSYPKTAAWKWKSDFTSAEWITLLKTELDASHPLFYTGFNNTAQHQHYFICDGYQGDDFFHFNWGWGGAYDGYYYLNNLTPDTITFSAAQSAIFNLAPSTVPDKYIMNFENVGDFALTFNDWTTMDVDHHDTYFIEGHEFPHNGEPMAFLSFNPALVTPSMAADPAIQPHGGLRFGACFSSNPPSNNDWFISPQIQLGVDGSFSFWIKSYNDTYKVDDYFVAVSTTDNNPASFTTISGPDTLHTTTTWEKKSFSLAGYNNQKVYVAIHCVSNDHFLMMIDDLEVKPQQSSGLVTDFTADKTTVKTGESVTFTDQSSGAPTSWAWTFAGGTPGTSAVQNPAAIKYSTAGTYPVKLKVSNGISSDSLTKTGYITVTGYPSTMSLDFESLSDFTLVFNPWTVVDVKGGNTYGIQGISFTNNYLPMAYICFNPSKTNPALINMQAHSGQRLGCCFSTIPTTPPAPAVTPNDKWLISPRMSLGINPQIEFWVKTYNAEFGLERYNVAVSTAGLQPSDFMPLTILPEEAPVNWTKKNYGLQDYAGQDVYIGIQCITDNGFIFMIDDISITSTVGTGDKDASEQLVIFPNPASDQINLKFTAFRMEKLNIKLYDVVGTEIMSWDEVSPAGIISLAIPKVIQGVYVMKIMYGTNEIIRKISVIK